MSHIDGREVVLSWLQARAGYRSLHALLARDPRVLDGILGSIGDVHAAAPVSSRRGRNGNDPNEWGPSKRLEANMRALRVFETLRMSGEEATPEDHEALLGYSGWGGIDPKDMKETAGIPAEVNNGIREWQAALREGRIPTTNLFRGVLDQFFTPLAVCRAMWALAQRAVPGKVFSYALETSAGIGRFLQGAPADAAGINWTLVERDPFLAQFCQFLWPQSIVVNDMFERFVGQILQSEGRYDLILTNPPYGAWSKIGQQHDPGMVPYASDTQTYFLKRSLDLLAPGGVLVVISTAGQLIGRSEENQNLRRFMLADAHMSGAALVGVDLFSRLGAAPAAGIAISCWVKLPAGARAQLGYSQRDHAILAGKYFESTEDGQASVLGTWATGRYGDPVVKGPFDEKKTASIPMEYLPTGILPREEKAAQRPAGAVKGRKKPVVEAEPEPEETLDNAPLRDIYEETSSIQLRLARYYTLLEGTAEQRHLAAAGRMELLRDLVEYLQVFGNPHAMPTPKGDSWLERVVAPTGEIHASLSQGLSAQDLNRPTTRPATPAEAVQWYSRTMGVCTELDLMREFPDVDLVDVVLSNDDLALEMSEAGPLAYDRKEYLSGDLYRRLDLLTASLASGSVQAGIKARLTDQKAWLMESIAPRTIVQIDARPHSGFVPVEALSAFVNEQLLKSDPPTSVEIWKEEGRYRCRTNGALQRAVKAGYMSRSDKTLAKDQAEDRRRRLTFLMGYLNRESEVVDPDEVEAKLTRRYRSDDPEDRKQEDVALETEFSMWLAQSDQWRPVVEEGYNRAYRSDHLRDYPPLPLPVTRLSPDRKPHGHQWAAARRMDDRGAVLLNWAVGAGKTAGALTTLAWLRQNGKAQRVIIVMPNPILSTWIAETAAFLPDFRVGTIGLTYDRQRNLYRSDVGHDAERVAKWRRFAAGGYDVLLCTRSSFLRDVAVDPETMRNVLGKVEWMQRGLGKDAEQRRLLQRRIGDAEGEIEERRKALKTEGDSQERARLNARIQVLEANIRKWSEDVKEPSKTVLAKVQELIEGNIQAGIFRPDGAPGLVNWNDLGCDLLVVDEAHGYKNLYAPGGRYGAESIAYMGSKRWSDDWSDFTVTAWDLYLKTSALMERTGGKGVMLLTATPVKNSPLEVYNIFSYLSDRIWTAREITSGEEWIDRYINLAPKTYPTADGGLRTDLAVTGFNETNIEELHDIFRVWMYRLTTKDLVSLGLIPPDALPEGVEVPADVPMDSSQQELYRRMKQLVNIEEQIAELADTRVPGAIRLLRLDMAAKIATDPRLLQGDVDRVAALLVMDAWVKKGGKGGPPDVVVEYPLPEFEEDEQEQEAMELLRGAGVTLRAHIDGERVLGPKAKPPKEGRNGKERKGLNDVQLENLNRRYLILLSLRLENVYYSEAEGILPPKYMELAEYVNKYLGCGHLIFSDYNETHEWIKDALVYIAGVPEERIRFLTGEVTPVERDAIATKFNGASRQVHPLTGALLREAIQPEFDVLIGNTVMAEGLNLQTRTCAIHHLSLPWEPATLQQRNGRGVRQGNTLDMVAIRMYVARGSMDMKRKDTILGKASWQESLLSGATAGSIELDMDWDEIMIAEFATSAEEAATLIEKAKREQEERTRDRLTREVYRDFRAMVALYDRARKAPTAADRKIQTEIGDRFAMPLRSKMGRLGLDLEALEAARDRVVWLLPRTGFWLAEGEGVELRSDDARDGAYHNDPVQLRVEWISPSWNSIRVRGYGNPGAIQLILPENVAPSNLLEPGAYKSVSLQGRIERVGRIDWNSDVEWPTVREAMLGTNATILSMHPQSANTTSPDFRTVQRSREVWRTGVERILAKKLPYFWLGDTYSRDGSSGTKGIPLVKEGGDGSEVLLVIPTQVIPMLRERSWEQNDFWKEMLSWRPLSSVDPEDYATYDRAVRTRNIKRIVLRPTQAGKIGPFGVEYLDRKDAQSAQNSWFGYRWHAPSAASVRSKAG